MEYADLSFIRIFYQVQLNWKNSSDQTYSCLRDWRLSASCGTSEISTDHNSTIVRREFRVTFIWPPLCWETSFRTVDAIFLEGFFPEWLRDDKTFALCDVWIQPRERKTIRMDQNLKLGIFHLNFVTRAFNFEHYKNVFANLNHKERIYYVN